MVFADIFRELEPGHFTLFLLLVLCSLRGFAIESRFVHRAAVRIGLKTRPDKAFRVICPPYDGLSPCLTVVLLHTRETV